jgi:ABC-type polysaccharide/polyol phosphate export permease
MHTLARARSAPAFRELGYWLFRYRRTWRGSIVISVANPLLFLTALGLGLGKLINRNGSESLHGHPYVRFILPGMLIAAVMQTAFLEAAGPVMQGARPRGNYRAAASTPLAPADILYGHLMYWTLRSVTVTRPSQLNTMFRFVILPLYMFSGTFFPIEQLPAWLRPAAWATPLWHGVDLCRTVALGTATLPGTLIHMGYLSAMAIIGLFVARRSYRRKLYV